MSGITLLGKVFDSLPVGVVILDQGADVVLYNRFEEQLAGRKRKDVVGRNFFEEVAPCTNVVSLGRDYAARLGDGSLSEDLLFRFPKPFLDRPRDVRLQLDWFDLDDERYGLLLVDDVSSVRGIERTKDFLGRMLAHDMNNPLTVIKSTLELWNVADDPGDRELRDNANLAADRLKDLVTTLFDITRLHSSDMPSRVEEHELPEVLRATAEGCRGLARPRNIQIAVEAPTSLLANIDAALIRRAVENLVDNAVRFSPDGGRVTLQAARQGDNALIAVADQGPGINPELRQSIFEPLVQGGSETGASEHHGLGLALVDLVVREHGGTVSVDCPSDGGTVFTLALPIGSAD